MHGSRSKIPSKNLVSQRCAEGFNSGVKGLIGNDETMYVCITNMESVFSVNGLFISVALRNTSEERYERKHDKVNVYF
jgi:hypothetical protein